MARRRLKLVFSQELVGEPVIYELGRRFQVVTNIRRADVTQGSGWVVLELSGERAEIDGAVAYAEQRGVQVTPAEGDVVE